jgi:hypothetical protein
MYDELKLVENDDTDKLIKTVSHNSVLNCLLLLTNSNQLYIYDCNTRSYLTKINWNVLSSTTKETLASSILVSPKTTVKLINIQEKCIILSDKTICSRTAYDGTLLLDSAFQVASSSNNEQYKFELEINLNDAYTLVNVLKSIEVELIHGLDEIIKQLTEDIQRQSLFKNDSVSFLFKFFHFISLFYLFLKWNTVKINGAHGFLLLVFTQSLDEIKRINSQSLGIPILSSLLDRLFRLDVKYSINQIVQTQAANFQNYDKRLMCSEANRRATYQDWPHMDYK